MCLLKNEPASLSMLLTLTVLQEEVGKPSVNSACKNCIKSATASVVVGFSSFYGSMDKTRSRKS